MLQAVHGWSSTYERLVKSQKFFSSYLTQEDITSIVRISEQGDKTTYWTYQEAALTPREFNEYTNLLMAENAIKGTNDSDNIVQLMAGQETGDSQQLAIMEAIADLYDAVAAMIPE